MYTSPLEDIIASHGFGKMIYADDTQVYVILKHNEHSTLIPKLEQCIMDIKSWSSDNHLKLNEDKTEVLHITSKFRKPSILSTVDIAGTPIRRVKCARNLGVVVVNNLSMEIYE